jgi:integrase
MFAGMKRTKNDYIFEHPQSRNLYVRLRGADGKRHVESLGTSDYREAEILALPKIAAHKAALLRLRPRVETTWELQFPPGMHTDLEGARVYATATELHYIDETPVRIEANGFTSRRLLARGPLDATTEFKMFDAADNERPTPPKKNGDDAILDTYLTHRNIMGHPRREAEATWTLYKSLIGKPLKSATRDDGRRLVKHFADAGNKSATIAKKLGWLRAMCEFAIGEGTLSFNPFAKVIPSENDELKRKPLSDTDMEVCKKNLHALSESDQLLFRFLATSGARLGEAFQIDGEATERDVRYVVIGSKTEASQRRVPLPSALLPFLPKGIKGPLFAADPSVELAAKAASKRLNDFLDECGLTDPSLVVHSLRHRAADRLRAYECPVDIRHALLGHETRSVAEGYGAGFPVTTLKKWIDCIGGP